MKHIKLVIVALCLVVVAGFGTGCASKPNAGEIGVVRNGGPFDNHNIRGHVENGAGNTWTGWFSSVHYYPIDTQQRFFKMATCYDDNTPKVCKGADGLAITVPTADGVDVTIEGTFYLNTAFNNSPQGLKALDAFDTQFATRTFDGDHAYDGTEGWEHFLAAIVEPIVVNNLRETISGVSCADLQSSCALVQNNSSTGAQTVTAKAQSGANKSKISEIQNTVESNLETDLKNTIGGNEGQVYFKNIKFNLARVLLPGRIQSAINEAQSSFAQVSQAQAKVKSADLEAQANEKRQKGYEQCPACAQIDTLKAIPSNVTTFAPGASFAVGPGK